MLHTSNPIIKHKAGLLNLAEELGNNISIAFYTWLKSQGAEPVDSSEQVKFIKP